jgi:cytochrome c
MDRSRWIMVGVSVAGWLLVAWTLNWFTQQFAAEAQSERGRLAYAPFEQQPPRVDLASVQRGWPNSLEEGGDSVRLTSYLRDMEGKAPPPAAGPQPGAAPTPEPDLGTLLASADANAGKEKVQVCKTCHNFEAGAPDRIGPDLWQVVGRDIASRPGFAYSTAMVSQQGNWTYEKLYDFLAHPSRTVPGTKMGFAGLRKPEDRAAVIKYLSTLGGTPPPFPQPQGGGAEKVR